MTPTDAEMEYAGFWQRFGALFLDSLLIYVLLFVILLIFYGTIDMDDPHAAPGIAGILVLYALPPALIMTFWIRKSATPGKMAIAATIVDAKTGGKPTTKQFLIRYLGYGLSTLPCFLGYLWVVFDARKQSWHDKLADTVVVRRKAGMSEQVSLDKPLNEPAN